MLGMDDIRRRLERTVAAYEAAAATREQAASAEGDRRSSVLSTVRQEGSTGAASDQGQT